MKALLFTIALGAGVMMASAFISPTRIDLRKAYSKPPAEWPTPFVDSRENFVELGMLPESPLHPIPDSVKALVELGRVLFFDTRLSCSGKLSCSSCHEPERSWTDGKARSEGHEGALNKRNAPTIQNVWYYKQLFWDGRSHSLEDQAFAPINSETEMHSEMGAVVRSLRGIPAYRELFEHAYGDPAIDPERLTHALAVFQRTITSARSRFDAFLAGNRDALTDAELRGLHLFRTKARCINCHNGPMFTDNDFHNNGFAGRDVGRYFVSHADADSGKMKTPSLRDVTRTGPWMHDGSLQNLGDVINRYNTLRGIPGLDKRIKPLGLTRKERADLQAFLEAISADPVPFERPKLP